MDEQIKIKITAQIAEAQRNLKQIQDEVSGVGESGEDAQSKFKAAMEKVGKAAKQALKVTAAAAAAMTTAVATGVVAISKKAIENYAEYEQLIGGVETLFKDSAKTVEKYANEAYKSAGMSANEYMTTVTSFSASLLQSLGGDTAKAADAANQAVIDMSDNANKMGTSIEAIQNAYQGFAKQNFTMLDNLKLGYGGTKEEMQRLLEDAEKISGVKYDITNLNDVYSAIHTIQTELGIAGTTAKEAGSTIQGSAAAMKAAWSNLLTGIADENADFDTLLENFIDSILTFGENLIPRIGIALEGVVKLISGLVPKIAEILPQLIQDILPMALDAVLKIIKSVAEALPTLIKVIVDIIPSLIQAIVTAFNAIVESLPIIIQTIVDALPTVIPALIDGVASIIVNLCENIMNIIQPILDALPDIIITIIDALMRNLPQIIGGIITLVMGIVQAIPEIIENLVDALPTIVSMLIEGLLGCLPQIIGGLIEVVWGITKSLPNILGSLITGIVNIFKGIWDGLGKVFAKLAPWFKEKFKGAAEGIKSAFSGIANFFSGIWEKIKSIFSKVGKAVADAITNTVKKAVNGVLSAAIKIINGFISAINFAIDIINAIPGVNIKRLSKLETPKLAKGGIVDSATLAVIGEQGKEAVVPLENNTEWIDMLAAKIVGATGGNKPIILQVSGRTFAETCINTMNDYTKQRGALALNIY